jgi:hypothetical protein
VKRTPQAQRTSERQAPRRMRGGAVTG